MEILEEKKIVPMEHECRFCDSKLNLLPEDFGKPSDRLKDIEKSADLSFICPVCGRENEFYCHQAVHDPRFYTELQNIVYGMGIVRKSRKRNMGLSSIRNRFINIFLRNGEVECEITMGENREKRIDI